MEGGGDQAGHPGYADFEVEVARGEAGVYPIDVRSPAGDATATLRFPFDGPALENRLLALENALLRSGGTRRLAPSSEHGAVQEFGRALFEALLPDDVRRLYYQSRDDAAEEGRGLRLKLRVAPPELSSLPWEFLYDPRTCDYVALSTSTPVVRDLGLAQPIRPLAVDPPLRVLAMVASPANLAKLDVPNERRRVEDALRGLRDRGIVELTWLGGESWRELQGEIRREGFHVFHFVGHGGFDEAADEGLIALSGDDGDAQHLSATNLAMLLADEPRLRLVVLNSCDGARGGTRDVFSSTASVLVRRGIPAVLAMQYEITDQAAIEFARAFYEAVADGMPVDTAVAEARQAVRLAIPGSLEWATPVLHQRSPDGVLFRVRVPGGSLSPAPPPRDFEPPHAGEEPKAFAPSPGLRQVSSGAEATQPRRRGRAGLAAAAGLVAAAIAVIALIALRPFDPPRTPSTPTPPTSEAALRPGLAPNPLQAAAAGACEPGAGRPLGTLPPASNPPSLPAMAGGMFRGDPARAGAQPGPGPMAGSVPADAAEFPTRGEVFSSPAVVDGTAYVGSYDEHVYAVDAATMGERWRFKTGGWVRSSPAVADGAVYVGSYDRFLYALHAAPQGSQQDQLKWRFDAKGEVFSSPLVADGVVYVGSGANIDERDDAKRAGFVHAVDAATGAALWCFAVGEPVLSSPALADGILYVGGWDFNVYALDAATGSERRRFATGDRVVASPAVADGLVYVGCYDGKVYALDAATLEKRWERQTDGLVYSSPAVADGTVFVASWDGFLHAFDADNGSDRWPPVWIGGEDRGQPASIFSSPVVADGIVYVGGEPRGLFAVDAAAGRVRGVFRTSRGVRSSPAVVGGAAYVGSEEGVLYAIRGLTGLGTPTA